MVGNCYFLTAAASIDVQQPEKLEETFCNIDQYSQDKGFVDVNFFVMNVPITIRIDDNIPYQSQLPYSQIKALRFAPPTTNYGTWVSLLEKAFAKYRGSYGAMDLGSARDGM